MEKALASEVAHLKERTLGVEVFGRENDYDTNLDPVVRTTAGEIRKRIAQYYHEAGHESEIRIDLPSGSYVPEFRMPVWKEKEAAPPVRPKTPAWPRYALPAVILVAAVITIGVSFETAGKTPLDRFWEPAFGSSEPVLLCVGPANLTTAGAEPLTPDPTQSISEVQRQETQHIALSDAIALGRVAGVVEAHHKSYHVRNAAVTTLQDLRDSPTILLGAFNNHWTLRVTSQLRFSFARNPATRDCWISDRQKPSSRDWLINMTAPYAQLAEDYAIVARVTDPTTERPVIVGAGISIYGTRAAGEFLSNNAYLRELVKQAPAGWEHKNIEAVIATHVINGNSGPPRVVATHFW